MSDIKYVPHRDAVQIRLEGTEMPYIFMARNGDALYIYDTGMPRHGDAFIEINMAQGCLISGLFN